MSATDAIITLAAFAKFELPGGDVRLCDGGMLEYDSEQYLSQHPVFGTVHSFEEVETAIGDLAEDWQMVLAPNPEADVADWWRSDLFDCRLRVWTGEVDADGYTVSTATLVRDLLVSTYSRQRGADGRELLAFEFIGRTEKLFLRNEGNVCSTRFHTSVWSGELGFDNCTGIPFFVAWGVAGPPRGASGAGGGGGGGGGNRGPFGIDWQQN